MDNFEGKNYVGGKFYHPFHGTFKNINPATESVLGEFPLTTNSEVKEVILVARRAFKKWKDVSRLARAEYFYKISQ